MLVSPMRIGLLGLMALMVPPAQAQSWPGDSGPSGDLLRGALQQFERLDRPPVEMTGRLRPDLLSDLPEGSVDVGQPSITPPAASARPARRSFTPRETRRRSSPAVVPVARRSEESRIDRLERELAERGREIERLQRQIELQR
jgi:hypothetical protein